MAIDRPEDIKRVWAESAPSANVIDPNDTTPGKYSDGWQAEVPPFEHFNFIQNLITKSIAYLAENSGVSVNSVSDLKSTDYQVDDKVTTLGYYNPGDGGINTYLIVAGGTGTDDGGSFIDLDNGLQAKGLFDFGAVSVRQFGAVGGDEAVDQAAFEAAVAYSLSVFVNPTSSPYILDRLQLRDDSLLYGVGPASKILLAPGDKGDTDVVSAGAIRPEGVSNAVVRDIEIDGNKANVTGTNELNIECLDWVNCTGCRTIRVRTLNAKSDGVDYDNCVDCYTIYGYAQDCDGWGVHISLTSVRCYTIECEAVACGIANSRGGFDVLSTASDSKIVNCVSRDCYRGAFADGANSHVIGHRSYGDENGIRLGENAKCFGGEVRGSLDNGCTLAGDGASAKDLVVRGSLTSGVIALGERVTLTGVESYDNGVAGISFIKSGGDLGNVMVGCRAAGNTPGRDLEAQSRVTGSGNYAADDNYPIGTTALLQKTTAGGGTEGSVVLGSEMLFSNTSGSNTGTVPDGTWVALSAFGGTGSTLADRPGFFVRVQ